MQTISPDINVPLTVLDADVASGTTVRCNVFNASEGTEAYAVELRVTLLGAQPVNLAMRVLGQLSTPAADPTQLQQLNVAVPDMSALAANFSRIFVLPVFTPFQQLEFQNISGGNVHVQAIVQACDAEFVDAPAAATGGTSIVQLAAGTADAGTVHLATGGVVGLTGAVPAGANKIGSVDVARNAPYTPKITAADTNAHAFPSQAVKTTVFIRTDDTMTGYVTISDGTNGGVTLPKNSSAPFECSNMNQLTYQFSTFATTEKFSVSVGI